ncbi:MAG: 16S rRNA (guanine(527)-N(7))-methyltransferase RsmG [Muribaculaceae bacterium]|nr:16S rRNA (guanine(527)-N(7))-methyltransferase RsmG [Muribaculaceae bacterium]
MDIFTDSVDLLTKYFPTLNDSQKAAYEALGALYADWNSKINVISRSDVGNLYSRHILHSLALAAFFGDLSSGTTILDIGTGGGFPGIPLAIFYPEVQFHLIDRIGKKIKVAGEVAAAVGLENVTFQHGDVGECHRKFDYVVSRAVMPLEGLLKACSRNVYTASARKNRYHPGLVCLKGGDLKEEIEAVDRAVLEIPVSDFFAEEFFKTKQIVYVPFIGNKKK